MPLWAVETLAEESDLGNHEGRERDRRCAGALVDVDGWWDCVLPTATCVGNANLRGADLSNANLTGADLSNANLTGAIGLRR